MPWYPTARRVEIGKRWREQRVEDGGLLMIRRREQGLCGSKG